MYRITRSKLKFYSHWWTLDTESRKIAHSNFKRTSLFCLKIWNFIEIIILWLSGCNHADEIGYFFKLKHLPIPKKRSTAYRSVRRFGQILNNFCTYGNPSTEFAPDWKSLQEDNTVVLDFGKDVSVIPFPEAERMRLWQKIMQFDKRNTKLSYFKVV